MFRKGGKSSSISRTPSVDSRGVQTDEILEKCHVTSLYKKPLITQTSSPSAEGVKFKWVFIVQSIFLKMHNNHIERQKKLCHFRSQLSVCSEPSNIPAYQVANDHPLSGDVPKVPHLTNAARATQPLAEEKNCTISEEQSLQIKRPTTLVLDCNRVETFVPHTSITINTSEPANETTCENTSVQQARISKALFRSNSSTFAPVASSSSSSKFKLSNELDQIFVISSNRPSNIEDDNYNSIEVIDERRIKNMKDRAKLYKSNTFASSETANEDKIIEHLDQ